MIVARPTLPHTVLYISIHFGGPAPEHVAETAVHSEVSLRGLATQSLYNPNVEAAAEPGVGHGSEPKAIRDFADSSIPQRH